MSVQAKLRRRLFTICYAWRDEKSKYDDVSDSGNEDSRWLLAELQSLSISQQKGYDSAHLRHAIYPVTIHALAESELESDSNLPFSSGQHLSQRAEGEVRICSCRFYRSRILAIEQIEELEEDLHFGPLANRELFRKAHIEINKSRRSKGIPPRSQIDAVEIRIAVPVKRRSSAAEVKSALCSEDAAELHFPWERK